ncbi:MAG TPA: hypothetical protein VLV88_03160 [Terriglobales bacterium]|nr:hypothetical protein [Terriglobales bacterium]
MKNLRTIAVFALMLGIVVGSVHGQTGTPTIKVNVPFRFAIGGISLSSGQYSITSVNDRVLVQEASGRSVALLMTRTLGAKAKERNSRVVFDCYFDECFLSQVWFASLGTGHTLPQSKHQVELAKTSEAKQLILSSKESQ